MNELPSSPSRDSSIISALAASRLLSETEELEVLLYLQKDSSSVKAMAMDEVHPGRWIDLAMQRSTTTAMLLLAIFALIPSFYIYNLSVREALPTRVPYTPFIVVGLILIGLVILRPAFAWILFRLAIPGAGPFLRARDESEARIHLATILSASATTSRSKTILRRAWKFFAFISPFYYRFVWWWILIFGFGAVQIEYTQYMIQEEGHTESLPFTELAMSLLKVLVVSVIAFIATNVLREVLLLRERYATSAVRAQTLIGQLSEMAVKVEELGERFQPLSEHMYDVLSTCAKVLDVGNHLSEFTNRLRSAASKPALQKQHREFLVNIGEQMGNLVKQIDKSRDGQLSLWILTTVNRYISTQREILNTSERRLITRFSDLARLGRDLVEVSFPGNTPIDPISATQIEFYGLMAIPPDRFLNNGIGENPEEGAAGDKNWEAYLEGNRNAAGRGIRQHRYFLAVRKASPVSASSPEAQDVDSDRVKSLLRKWVKLDSSGKPVIEHNGGGARRYLIEGSKGEGRTEEWAKLGDVLANTFHAPNCCKVREFSNDEFKREFIDKERGKPLDYFAIRRAGKWVFCLRSIYDKDLMAADIEIFYDDPANSSYQQRWLDAQETLNKIFIDKIGKTIPVEKYGE